MTEQIVDTSDASETRRDKLEQRISELEEQTASDKATIDKLNDELQHERQRVDQLSTGLVNARRIGAAIGVLMASSKDTYDVAFRMLSGTSQAENVKLHVVAVRVLAAGTLERLPGPV